MYPGIGSPGAERRDGPGAQPAERSFEHPLHGAPIGLALPPAEVRAIVVQHELQRASRHRPESYRP
jgi:hypothetical protein